MRAAPGVPFALRQTWQDHVFDLVRRERVGVERGHLPIDPQRGRRACDKEQVAAADLEEPLEPVLETAGISGRRRSRSDGVQFVDDAVEIEVVSVHGGSIRPASL